MQWINEFSKGKLSWLVLFISSCSLFLAALYFQHIVDLRPCIQCIYQRTAVICIMLAGVLPLIYNSSATRLLAYAIWGFSAYKGLQAAREHLEIIFATNPFANICDIVPNFPSFLPLHEWLPSIFAATGDCNENSWKFLDMGMASWLQIIFIAYLFVLGLVLVIKAVCLFQKRSNPT